MNKPPPIGRTIPLSPCPPLLIYEPPDDIDRHVLIEIDGFGVIRFQFWTEADFLAIDPADRPDGVYRKAGVYFRICLPS